jgi:hypothetical protein
MERASCGREVAMDTPEIDARAPGSMAGRRRPVSAGMKTRSAGVRASPARALICCGLSNHCSFSQIQLSAEPVVGT